jgi:hypothetical protein
VREEGRGGCRQVVGEDSRSISDRIEVFGTEDGGCTELWRIREEDVLEYSDGVSWPFA